MKTKIFDEHCEVLADWWERSIRSATLVFFDAHLDLQYISPARIQRLKTAASIDEVRSLAKPHHHFPDLTYSYSIEDFLYAASQLGIVRRVIWVAPPHVLA